MIVNKTPWLVDGFKLTATVLVSVLITTYIVSRNFTRDKLEPPLYVYKSEPQDFFTQEDILYFTTGEGNASDHQYKLPSFVRSQLGKPSRKFVETYKGWPKVDHSLHLASPMIDKVLRGRKNGFYIECGGADGIYESTSALFELTRNWSGLLIEGNLGLRPKILTRGRNAYILNACLSTTTKPMLVEFNNAFGAGGLKSAVGNLHNGAISSVTCYPFWSIMDAIGRTHIDLFILDVQGPELEIFKTIDFKKYRIDVIVAEHDPYPPDPPAGIIKIRNFRKFFEETGLYKEVHASGPNGTFNKFDILFHRKDFQPGSLTN